MINVSIGSRYACTKRGPVTAGRMLDHGLELGAEEVERGRVTVAEPGSGDGFDGAVVERCDIGHHATQQEEGLRDLD